MANSIRYLLTKINEDFRVYVGVITQVNGVSNFKGKVINQSTITKAKFPDGDKYNISAFPYVTIDFTSYDDKLEAYNAGITTVSGCRINLNKYNLFLFVNMLKKLERDFVDNKNLYYYSNGRLVLNKQMGESISIDTIIADKRIMIHPTVIEVGGGEREHEGISISLTDLSNITFLTYTEFSYLRYILDKLNLDQMALDLIKLVGEDKIVSVVNKTAISIDSGPMISMKSEEIDKSSSGNHIIEKESVIPII